MTFVPLVPKVRMAATTECFEFVPETLRRQATALSTESREIRSFDSNSFRKQNISAHAQPVRK